MQLPSSTTSRRFIVIELNAVCPLHNSFQIHQLPIYLLQFSWWSGQCTTPCASLLLLLSSSPSPHFNHLHNLQLNKPVLREPGCAIKVINKTVSLVESTWQIEEEREGKTSSCSSRVSLISIKYQLALSFTSLQLNSPHLPNATHIAMESTVDTDLIFCGYRELMGRYVCQAKWQVICLIVIFVQCGGCNNCDKNTQVLRKEDGIQD